MWGQLFNKKMKRRPESAGVCNVAAAFLESLECRTLLSAVTVQFSASHDNTLYNSASGEQANGAGSSIVVGGSSSTASAHRGLLSFDISTAHIPVGSTILDAVLTLNLSHSVGGASDVGVYRMLTAWGESTSVASGNEFEGAAAQASDATWNFSKFDATSWLNPGGDFGGLSASVEVNTPGAYEWVGAGLISDVQYWVDQASSNFGWLLRGNESGSAIAAFVSRDSSNAALRPTLEITFEEPVVPGIVEGQKFEDPNGDGIRQSSNIVGLNLQYWQGNNYFNSYGGNEYWYRSQTNSSWYFLTPGGALTKWNGQTGKLNGTVVEQIGSAAWNSPKSIFVTPGSKPEGLLNGSTFQLVDPSGIVIATTTTGGIDINGNGVIDPETENGWYRFQGVRPGRYSIREALGEGWVQSPSAASPEGALASQLKTSLGLTTTGNLFLNFGGLGEKWLKGTNAWYYITPVGEFFKWNGKALSKANPLSGTLLGSLGMAYYRNISLLYNAIDPVLTVQAGTTLTQPSVGTYRPAKISGKTWIDTNPDGLRNPSNFSKAKFIEMPLEASATVPSTATWISVPSATGANLSFYYATVSGNVYQWSGAGGSVLFSSPSTTSDILTGSVSAHALASEPLTDGVQVQLLDSDGYVVASAVSASVDANGDGSIGDEEKGSYQFSNLLPGKYTVRQVPLAGTVQVSHGDARFQAQVASMHQQLGFKASSRDWYNFGGRKERWFQGKNNDWYFITPQGTAFEWDKASGGTKGPASGRQIMQLSSGYYMNLNLLFQPKTSTVIAQSTQHTSMDFGSVRVIDSIFASLAGELL